MLFFKICARNKYAPESHIPHMPITSCPDIRQICQYTYLTGTPCKQQCNQEHCYTYIIILLTYSPFIYTCHITHVGPTTLKLCSTCRPHSTAHKVKNKKNFIFHFPCFNHIMCEQEICLSNAIYMQHIPITSCTYETTMSVYRPHMNSVQLIMWPGALVYISQYCLMPLNKYACHIAQLCPTTPLLRFTDKPTLLHIFIKNKSTATFVYHAIFKYVPVTYMPLKCQRYCICPNYLMCTDGQSMLIYVPHMKLLPLIM